MQARKLYLDTSIRAFVADPTLVSPAVDLQVFEEDVDTLELYFLEPTGDATAPYRYLDYSGNTIKAAVGVGQPAALGTSFSAISTTVAITISNTVTGGSGTSSVQRVTIGPSPNAGSYALRLPSRNITVSSVSSSIFTAPYHALLDGQSVTLTGFSTPSGFSNGSTYVVRDRARDTFRIANSVGGTALTVSVSSGGGTAVSLTYTTVPIPFTAQIKDVEAALANATGSSVDNADIKVVGVPYDYSLNYSGNFSGADMGVVQSVANTLQARRGVTGTINFNTQEMAALVAAGTTDATLEIEVSGGGLKQTFQTNCTIGDDIISGNTTPTVVSGSSFTIKDSNNALWNVTIGTDGTLSATKQ